MPTKCLKAENLFNIIKRLIIGLEEKGIKVLCVIMNNNAINKKAMSLFCTQKNFNHYYTNRNFQLHIHIQFSSLDLFFSYLTQSIF